MTDEQIIDRLAVHVMGWHLDEDGRYLDWKHRRWYGEENPWNPLIDWNHFRQVEERVIEDEDLAEEYLFALEPEDDGWERLAWILLKADLPTRCKAVLNAFDSLQS